MSGIDWPSLLRAAHGLAGLTPEAFWRLTPAEFRILTGRNLGPAPMTRAGLDALERRLAATGAAELEGREDGSRRAER